MNKGVSLMALSITLVILIGLGLVAFLSSTKMENKEKKIEAIINGTIKCEVDYYREYSSGTAKIVSKDGTIYYTSDYTIIENGE